MARAATTGEAAKAETTTTTTADKELPDAFRHSMRFDDGRTFSYYTFAMTSKSEDDGGGDGDSSNNNKEYHPVLYLHGFPGCGLEGAVCASEIQRQSTTEADADADANSNNNKKRSRLFGLDRPGFGHTDLPVKNEDDDPNNSYYWYQDATVRDIWEFVDKMGWTSFSVIGVSGGGPYTLALLASYIEKQQKQQQCDAKNKDPIPRIEAMSVVAGACFSAGTDDMMEQNRQLHQAVRDGRKGSWWSATKLSWMLSVTSFAVRYLPSWVLHKSLSKMDVPDVDRWCLQSPETGEPTVVARHMVRVLQLALRQGGRAAELEITSLFYSDPEPRHETVLRGHYNNSDSKTDTNSSSTSAIGSPRIAVFHGLADKNVPFSHSKYVYEELLGCRSSKNDDSNGSSDNSAIKLVTYEDLGHLSLAYEKAEDYAGFVVA